MFNATFNNSSVISWRSVLLVKETGEKITKLPLSHWKTLSHNVLLNLPCLSGIRTHKSGQSSTDQSSINILYNSNGSVVCVGIFSFCSISVLQKFFQYVDFRIEKKRGSLVVPSIRHSSQLWFKLFRKNLWGEIVKYYGQSRE